MSWKASPVFNNSGEEYENAQVRLVGGTTPRREDRSARQHFEGTPKGLANGRLDDLRKKATHQS